MAEDGYTVCEKLVPPNVVKDAVKAIEQRARKTVAGYGIHQGDLSDILREATEYFGKTPEGWIGQRFGSFDKRGADIHCDIERER